jgi:hypothetical protein
LGSFPTPQCEIQDGLNGTGTGFFDGFFGFPTPIISLPLLHNNLSPRPDLGDSLTRQNFIISSVF